MIRVQKDEVDEASNDQEDDQERFQFISLNDSKWHKMDSATIESNVVCHAAMLAAQQQLPVKKKFMRNPMSLLNFWK